MPKWTKEQLEAIEKDGTNIIVSAGAGSGKTAVLSERVIYKLLHGIHINEILILTFTRAAAEEMKDRIRKKITKNTDLKEELDKIDSAYITTFDSFALSVLKKYHYLLNIKKDIEITDDSIVTIKKKEILDELFEEEYDNLTDNFDNLIKKYCVKNDTNLRNLILSCANKLEGFIDKDKYLNNLLNNFFTDTNINTYIEEYREFIKSIQEEAKLELQNLNYYFDTTYIDKINASITGLLSASLEELYNYKSIKLPQVPRGTLEEAKKAKEKLKKAIDRLLDYNMFISEDSIKENILSTKDDVIEIARLLKKYNTKLEKYKKENNIYTFSDIANLSIKIIKENKEAREELKNSFKEIMIDEYQDTNNIQETFISYISNNNVYMVGDIKQSIYRFRNSNPNIFKNKYDNYSKLNGGYKIDLIKNFRSREEVLNNINELFDLLMDDSLGGAKYYESHEMVFGNMSYNDEKLKDYDYNMNILEYENDKESNYTNNEVEIFTIANDIKEKINSGLLIFDKETNKLRKIKYSDFAIILDRSTFFEDYKKIFEYSGIPLTILKDGKLNTSDDIYLIKNIIDFIIHIKTNDYNIDFKYDFVSIARSFLYEYSDDYIFDIITNNKYNETTIYKDLSKIENINSITSSNLFEEILSITKFYEKIYKIGDYENINVRLNNIENLAFNLSNIGYTIYEFKDYLNKIIEENIEIKYTMFNDGADSVKILTIHKSKGLEYPICYFADIDHDFNTKEVSNKLILDDKYGIITPSNEDDSVLKILYKNNYMKEEISEKIRLFYVAITRAREKAIIVLPSKETTKLEKNEYGTLLLIRRLKYKRLSDFIYSCKDYLKKYFTNVDINKINLTKDYLYKKEIKQLDYDLNIDSFEVNTINIASNIIEDTHYSKTLDTLIDKNTLNNMKFGIQIHEILEYLDFKCPNLDIIDNNYIKSKINKLLNNEILKDINKADIYKEYEFKYKLNDKNYTGVIDLMLIYDDKVDIIDYKLKNTKDENYIKQLNGYKEYIKSKTNKKINTYLYSIIDDKLEEVL